MYQFSGATRGRCQTFKFNLKIRSICEVSRTNLVMKEEGEEGEEEKHHGHDKSHQWSTRLEPFIAWRLRFALLNFEKNRRKDVFKIYYRYRPKYRTYRLDYISENNDYYRPSGSNHHGHDVCERIAVVAHVKNSHFWTQQQQLIRCRT